jgi:putative phage-type endonuclease
MVDELIDITDNIIPEDNPKYFNDDESLELYQVCIYIMEEFIKDHPKLVSDPDFDETFDENIQELMHAHFDYDIFYTEEAEEEIDEIIEQAKKDFFKDFMPPRSYSDSIILEEPNYDSIAKQLECLRQKPQPVQRTKEWYEFRHNLITASNAYKAFENQTVQNQLIYEKCQPLNKSLYVNENENDLSTDDIKEVVMVNTNSTLHWGQKYEPLSVKIYEHTYLTTVEDFGCIQHEQYKFIGASPDGINVDPKTPRYGRMLEIKNIVNREIDGIPKKEYWIQMQMQMEVCDLDECDFLETKFIEYPDAMAYQEDTLDEMFEDEEGNEFVNNCLSKEGKMKGQIVYFHTKEGKPFYLYKPIDCVHPADISDWETNMVEIYEKEPYKYTYMKTIYWKLEHISCVLVCRNRQWFKDNRKDLQDIWSTIEKERVSGYEHRAPNRKQKKENAFDIMIPKDSNGCLLHFNKDSGKITVIKKDSDKAPALISIDTSSLEKIDINGI